MYQPYHNQNRQTGIEDLLKAAEIDGHPVVSAKLLSCVSRFPERRKASEETLVRLAYRGIRLKQQQTADEGIPTVDPAHALFTGVVDARTGTPICESLEEGVTHSAAIGSTNTGKSCQADFITASCIAVAAKFEATARGQSRKLRTKFIFHETGGAFSDRVTKDGRGQLSSVETLAAMGSSFGISLHIITQNLGMLSETVKNNIASWYIFRQGSYESAIRCADLLGESREIVPRLMNLGLGECIVRLRGMKQAREARVATPLFTQNPTQEEFNRRFALEWAELQSQVERAQFRDKVVDLGNWRQEIGVLDAQPARTERPNAKESLKQPEPSELQFFDREIALLRDILGMENLGVSQHYERLHWSVSVGHRITQSLLAKQLITLTVVKSASVQGGGIRKIARLTALGEQFLKSHEARPRNP
jgi:hypothetical protein